ncbi:MAG: hypothetical protein IMW91_01200 [Firmicutes bacterium]|nr:hypothetical protein [Bacillota bacterium]
MGDGVLRDLTADIALPQGGTLSFDTWYRMEANADFGFAEATSDGKRWEPLAVLSGESDWRSLCLALPAGTRRVRFRYQTDASGNGRGWYLHVPRVCDAHGSLQQAEWTADGWQRLSR